MQKRKKQLKKDKEVWTTKSFAGVIRTKPREPNIKELLIKSPRWYQKELQKFKEGENVVLEVHNKISKRTTSQNNALHLLFEQISDLCMEKGVDMRKIVREEVPIQCTPENIKWLWKLLQEYLFKKKSTRDLKKTGEIDIVYDNFNKILIERTDGEISLPPFPSIETQFENLE